MSEQPDGIDDAVSEFGRVQMTVAARTFEVLARRLADLREEERRAAPERAREIAERRDTELEVAVAQVQAVTTEEYWTDPNPATVQESYAVASAWSPYDDRANEARVLIEQRVREKWGMDPEGLMRADFTAQQANEAHRDANGDHGKAEEELERVRQEQVERRRTEDPAEQEASVAREREAREAAGEFYDTAERRDAQAEDLRAQGVSEEAVAAWRGADADQARPAGRINEQAARTMPKARKASGQERGAQAAQRHR